jgi:sulfate transport system ATP-binding protein
MDIAELVAVMNEGRVEQAASPRELYDEPANEFVMGFVGDVNRLGNSFVRPHDVEIHHEPNGHTLEAQVERIAHLGFEVRIELELADGTSAWAQLTRDEAARLEVRDGDIVFVRADRVRSFAEAG